jgi:hypothetical protein
VLERGEDERLVGIEGARPDLDAGSDDTVAVDGAADGLVMEAQLLGDGVERPVLGVAGGGSRRAEPAESRAGLPERELPEISEVAEAGETVAAARRPRPADHEFDGDERSTGKTIHGGVPAWRDAQGVRGGHTERTVHGAAVPERDPFGQRLQRARMLWGVRQSRLEDRDRAILYEDAGPIRAWADPHPECVHR